MRLGIMYFVAVILTALALAPAAAQLLALPVRLSLSDQDYVFMQYLSHGWAWAWLVAPAAFVADIVLVVMFRQRGAFKLVSLAALLIACTFLIDCFGIFPVDRITAHWAILPPNWASLRERWEYSSAINALLIFLSFCALALSAPVLRRIPGRASGYGMDLWYLR